MTWDVRALCTENSVAGLALAGIRAFEPASAASIDAELAKILAGGRTGIILIEDALYEKVSPEFLAKIAREKLPMLVPFPGPAWAEGRVEGRVVELLQRAIGYRVRLI